MAKIYSDITETIGNTPLVRLNRTAAAHGAQADVLLENYRPGVMDRLGIGPDVLCARNPRLVYGRMTGWGQEGPLANDVGHDVNYIALAGVLAIAFSLASVLRLYASKASCSICRHCRACSRLGSCRICGVMSARSRKAKSIADIRSSASPSLAASCGFNWRNCRT